MGLIKFIQKANDLGSKAYGALNNVYNAADSAVGGRLPYGVPEAPRTPAPAPAPRAKAKEKAQTFVRGSEKWTAADANNPVTKYINEVPEKGLLPVITVNPTHEALLTAAKYAAGPAGRHIRILRSPGTSEQLQRQVDGASVRGGKLYHGLGEPNYQDTRFHSNVKGGGIVGQFIGVRGSNNEVIVNEPYDTKDMKYHTDQYKKNVDKGDYINAAESVGNIVFRGLDDIGWANKYPRGREQVIGELKPGHPLYRAD